MPICALNVDSIGLTSDRLVELLFQNNKHKDSHAPSGRSKVFKQVRIGCSETKKKRLLVIRLATF